MIGRAMTGQTPGSAKKGNATFSSRKAMPYGNTEDATHFQANFGLLHEEY